MSQTSDYILIPEGRLKSLDFFRGFTMFLLIAEATHIYEHLVNPAFQGAIIHAIGTQCHCQRRLVFAGSWFFSKAGPGPSCHKNIPYRSMRIALHIRIP